MDQGRRVMLDFGVGLMGYDGCWHDAAFAEQHGFTTAGFVDSPLLAGDPFVCLGLAAQSTSKLRVGTLLAVPGNRSAPTTAAAIATVNKLAPGRVFLGLGTGYTSRNTFGLPPVPVASFREYAQQCRELLDGREVVRGSGGAQRAIRFRHREERHVSLIPRVPLYMAADGPKALAAAGELADGWITTLQYANVMGNAEEVFASSRASVLEAAATAGRSFTDGYTIWSTAVCVLEEGESAISPRALERVGPHAMMAFHSYSDNPAIAAHLPPAIQERIELYERNVMARFPVSADRRYQEAHRGHLSHLLEGEQMVLTEEIVRMTCLAGTAGEIAQRLQGLAAAGLGNVTFWIPPHLTRSVIEEVEQKLMPLLESDRHARS